jgi:2-polyprenyl-3-methyl-5-hydroxy-6-metoxy-1,4-benzoquinol methylase
MTPICRTCGSALCVRVGALPDSEWFAGNLLESGIPGGDLWRCKNCSFLFRSPLLSDLVYESLYRNGQLDVWDAEQDREDFRLIIAMLQPLHGQELSVLDFGCYTGQLLALLPASFRKFGIEPNRQAAAAAASKGIQIITDADGCGAAGRPQRYDIILCCDVIEHVPNPLELMTSFRSQLKSGGSLIVSTGNSDALLWRLTGSRFWYCQHAEHISFLSPRWMRNLSEQAGLELTDVRAFNYRGGRTQFGRALAAIFYRASPAIYSRLRGLFGAYSPGAPGIGATRDHILCRLKAI